MRPGSLASLLALAALFSGSLLAQAGGTEGEVKKIDKAQAKITLKHGEIRNLDMPGMTMVFVVKDKAILDKLKAGGRSDGMRFLYPYAGTVFPRGLGAPLMMWDGAPGQAVRRSPSAPVSAPPRRARHGGRW